MALLKPESDSTEVHALTAVPRDAVVQSEKTVASSNGAEWFVGALHRLDLEHRKLRTSFADRLGLAHNEYDAFTFIAEARTTTPKDLAAALRFTTGATTAMIDRLENGGLIRRVPNPSDRRSVLLELTGQGQTQADWVYDTYVRVASDAIASHETLTGAQLTEAVSHISTIFAAATEKNTADA